MDNGDTETGATTFFLTHEIDTGKIIRQKHLPIADTDDVGIVHDGLMTMGAGLVLETVDLLLEGKTDAVPQEEFYKDPSELRPAPKIFKETCRIDWLQPVKNGFMTSSAACLLIRLPGLKSFLRRRAHRAENLSGREAPCRT